MNYHRHPRSVSSAWVCVSPVLRDDDYCTTPLVLPLVLCVSFRCRLHAVRGVRDCQLLHFESIHRYRTCTMQLGFSVLLPWSAGQSKFKFAVLSHVLLYRYEILSLEVLVCRPASFVLSFPASAVDEYR